MREDLLLAIHHDIHHPSSGTGFDSLLGHRLLELRNLGMHLLGLLQHVSQTSCHRSLLSPFHNFSVEDTEGFLNERVFLASLSLEPLSLLTGMVSFFLEFILPFVPLPSSKEEITTFTSLFEIITAKLFELASILSFDHRFIVKRILFETDLDLLTAQLNQIPEDQQGTQAEAFWLG